MGTPRKRIPIGAAAARTGKPVARSSKVAVKKAIPGAVQHNSQRVRKHRDAKRKAGYKLVQMWVLDTNNPEVKARIRRQCELINQHAEEEMRMLEGFLAIADFSDWK